MVWQVSQALIGYNCLELYEEVFSIIFNPKLFLLEMNHPLRYAYNPLPNIPE